MRQVKELYERKTFSTGQLMKGSRKGAMPGIAEAKWASFDALPGLVSLIAAGCSPQIRSDFIFWFDSMKEGAEDSVNINFLISMIDSVVVQVSVGGVGGGEEGGGEDLRWGRG